MWRIPPPVEASAEESHDSCLADDDGMASVAWVYNKKANQYMKTPPVDTTCTNKLRICVVWNKQHNIFILWYSKFHFTHKRFSLFTGQLAYNWTTPELTQSRDIHVPHQFQEGHFLQNLWMSKKQQQQQQQMNKWPSWSQNQTESGNVK